MRPILAALLALAPVAAIAQHVGGGHAGSPPPYAGLEARDVKALSAEDIAQLRAGAGMGLALAAELNGAPGPAHVLEHADALALTEDQRAAVEAILKTMQADAIAEGERLIALETRLDRAFRDRAIDRAALAALTAEIGASRARLRLIHLAAHLETPPILTAEQAEAYARLRGYRAGAAADPGADRCAAPPPPGHDARLWRRHNGCDG